MQVAKAKANNLSSCVQLSNSKCLQQYLPYHNATVPYMAPPFGALLVRLDELIFIESSCSLNSENQGFFFKFSIRDFLP